MRSFRVAFLPAAIVFLGGCATDSVDLAPPNPRTPFAAAATSDGAPPDFAVPPRPELSVLQPPPETDRDRVYGLPDLIDIAERANPSTRIAWDEAREAALSVGLAQAKFLPEVAATVVGGYQKTSGNSAFQGPLSTSGSSNMASSLDGTVEAVSLKWLLFDFGQREAQVNAALQRSIAANVSFNGAHQKLIYDVTGPFYELSAARAQARNSAAAKRDAGAVVEASQAKLTRGVGTTLELAQARQLYAQAEYQDVRAQGSVRVTYQSLIAAMGISPVTHLRVEDVSSRPVPSAATERISSLVEKSLARRPDLQRAFAEVQASTAEIAAAKAEFLPKVFMTASGTNQTGTLDINSLPSTDASAPTSVQTSSRNFTVLGGAYIPLYDGGMRAARLEQTRASADSAMQQFVNTQQSAAHDIVVAANALRDAAEAYRAAVALVHASTTAYEGALAAYKAGTSTITEVIDAAKSLLQARNAQAEAHGTAFNAAATLAFATGCLTSADTRL